VVIVNIAKQFTRFPSGRYKHNGTTSGEAFRERFLEEPLRRGDTVTVELDGTVGYGSSFLEEAFGGLVRSLNLSSDEALRRINIESSDGALREEIVGYIRDAAQQHR
jgi:STAS-like domain of unknown function (DUF4325)